MMEKCTRGIIVMKMAANIYEKKLKSFRFDYLGGHNSIKSIILNANVSLFEKGILISTRLSDDFAFIEWENIKELIITKKKCEDIEIVYD